MLSILGWSFERSLVSTLNRRYSAQLVVTSAFIGGGRRNAPVSDRIVGELRSVPGVAAAAGEQHRDIRYGEGALVVTSYDPPCFLDRRVCNWPVDEGGPDALRLVAEGEAVAVSRSFANLYRTRPGDTVELTTMQGSTNLHRRGDYQWLAQNAVLMSRELYRRALE